MGRRENGASLLLAQTREQIVHGNHARNPATGGERSHTHDLARLIRPAADVDRAVRAVVATILSVAHLDDKERELVLGIVLDELLTWMRTQSGTEKLRALVVFDEVYGFLPPTPATPPPNAPSSPS